jgi:hypothetical protein
MLQASMLLRWSSSMGVVMRSFWFRTHNVEGNVGQNRPKKMVIELAMLFLFMFVFGWKSVFFIDLPLFCVICMCLCFDVHRVFVFVNFVDSVLNLRKKNASYFFWVFSHDFVVNLSDFFIKKSNQPQKSNFNPMVKNLLWKEWPKNLKINNHIFIACPNNM